MLPRTLILGLFLAGSLEAATITVELGSMDISGPGSDAFGPGATSIPLTGDLGDGSWTFTAALTTNLVHGAGQLATANGSLDVHFTDLTLTCTDPGGCFEADVSADINALILSPPRSTIYGWNVNMDGTGPNVELTVDLSGLLLDQIVSGPTYSFHQSGTVVPGGNFTLGMELFLGDVPYAQGTVLSLLNSLDFTLTPTPEPATFGLLAAGIGLAGWALRRRSKQL